MKRNSKPKERAAGATIAAYEAAQPPAEASICRKLRAEIARALPAATSKVWHGSPVWFLGETPVVGYNVPAKGGVTLLFWNGQAFGDPALQPLGKFNAAKTQYGDSSEIRLASLRRWLKQAGTNLWDIRVLSELRARARSGK